MGFGLFRARDLAARIANVAFTSFNCTQETRPPRLKRASPFSAVLIRAAPVPVSDGPSQNAASMRNRDFLQIDAPALAIGRALGRTEDLAPPPRVLVFDLQGGHGAARELRIDGRSVAVVPFPLSALAVVALALDTNDYPPDGGEVVRVLLPRAAFDRLSRFPAKHGLGPTPLAHASAGRGRQGDAAGGRHAASRNCACLLFLRSEPLQPGFLKYCGCAPRPMARYAALVCQNRGRTRDC
jgi:hypothetical protein